MPDLDKRVRAIMKREKLTYQQISDYADVSTQAVHKWLSSGSISDEKARVLAREIGVDWLWLKHGISRFPLQSFYDAVLTSTANIVLTCWDTLELVAVGQSLKEEFEYEEHEVLGKSVMDFVPGIKEAEVRRMQKLLHALSGFVDFSARFNLHDKHSVRAYQMRGRGITTDSDGMTYAIEELIQVEPDGTEDSPRSIRIRRRSAIPFTEHELGAIADRFPEYPWARQL